MTMAIIELQMSDFVAWTPHLLEVITILFNDSNWNKVNHYLQVFFESTFSKTNIQDVQCDIPQHPAVSSDDNCLSYDNLWGESRIII